MKDLLKTVETFLTYSEAKLEELSEKNQQLKTELPRKEEVKKLSEKNQQLKTELPRKEEVKKQA